MEKEDRMRTLRKDKIMKESTVRKGKFFKENKITDVVLAVLPVILFCLFPIVFLYFNNVGSVRGEEVLLPMVISAAIGLCIWLLCSIFLRSFVDGSILACLICVIGYNFKLIEDGIIKIIKSVKYWHLLPVCILLIILVMMFVLSKLSYPTRKDISFVCLIVIAGLNLFNIIQAVPQLVNQSNQEANLIETVKMEANSDSNVERPNVYWFIFDEYSNFDILEKYFDYDNSEFANFLEDKGFTVSYDSINDSQQTRTILSNYAYIDYVADDTMTYNDRAEMMKNGAVFDMLESYGYEINAISGGDSFGLTGNQKMDSTTMGGENFATLIMKNTVIYPFAKENTYANAQKYLDAFAKYKQLELYDKKSTVNFGYFLLPHQPFSFDSKGGKVPVSHINDWVNGEYYLNQLIYTTTLIEETVEVILENDPDSIIIIQSDHSARSLQTEAGEYIIEKFDRRHFLNTVYFRGEKLEQIKGKSGVNTLRIVFGKLLDVELPELEVPVSEYEF